MKYRLLTILLAFGMLVGLAAPGVANVERYQFETWEINVTSVNGNDAYTHYFKLTHNPCDDSWVAFGIDPTGTPYASITDISVGGHGLSFTATYVTGYTWYPTFTGEDGFGFVPSPYDNVYAATGYGEYTQTDYNRGEYITETLDEYGPDKFSCIGMPIVSNGKMTR